jgi:hypothetical protein
MSPRTEAAEQAQARPPKYHPKPGAKEAEEPCLYHFPFGWEDCLANSLCAGQEKDTMGELAVQIAIFGVSLLDDVGSLQA